MTATKSAAGVKVDARTPTDFGALFGEDVPTSVSVRGNEIDKYPNLVDAVQTAYDLKKAVLMPPRNAPAIPTDDARKLYRLLMQAATKLDIGISLSLVKDEPNDKWSKVADTKDVPYTGKTARVRFQPKERKAFDPDKPRRPAWTTKMSKAQYDEKWDAYVKSVHAWNNSHADVKIGIGDKATEPSKRGRPAKS